MSVTLEAGKIVLHGDCAVAEAEKLLLLLQANPDTPVDLGGVTHLHAAVLQLLIAFPRELIGGVNDSFLRDWVLPLMARHRDRDIM